MPNMKIMKFDYNLHDYMIAISGVHLENFSRRGIDKVARNREGQEIDLGSKF